MTVSRDFLGRAKHWKSAALGAAEYIGKSTWSGETTPTMLISRAFSQWL